ncbi:ABC transporter ATP-binding protein [Blastomonas sp. AAP53]|uniref:ABC transporter ATP-binding protein n=1 Tax=Blastomonas sp. AAP53 TaxID=1248760 RepID=UPI00031D7EE8|nr:ABC transporter ATP-binding protein [Blastomonas sp. AAP53]
MTAQGLEVSKASLAVKRAPLIEGASLSLEPGELVVLLGPNGAGKSSLLRVALGLVRPDSGEALIGGQPAESLSSRDRARAVTYLPQVRDLAWPIRVRDVVALGRFAYGAAPERLGQTDAEAIVQAMAACDLIELADRATDTLSGGELARVHIARALASQAPLMLADEPVASLDPRHQHSVMRLIRGFVDRGGGALVVLHDLDLAALHADRLVWMADGRTVTSGTVADTMTPHWITAIYGVRATVTERDGVTRVLVNG